MSVKSIVPCLDIRGGKVVKGTKFADIKEIASPLELAKKYNAAGADMIVLYDISASNDDKLITENLVSEIKKAIDVPLMVGGGINSIESCRAMLNAGADKLSINTGAIKDPELILNAASEFGSEKIVLSLDIKKVDGDYYIFTSGGSKSTGKKAIGFIEKAVADGASMVVVNSIDFDGVKKGFDIELLEVIRSAVDVPLVASGGAGTMEDFSSLFKADFDIGLAASVFHYGEIEIDELKKYLKDEGFQFSR